MSTALGRALGSLGVTVLLGDIAFVHDASALIAVADRGIALRYVVIDNDGGGIFSFLPQAEQLDPERFERLFGTPHGTDLAGLARAHGLEVSQPRTPSELRSALRSTDPMDRHPASIPSVIIVKTDRRDNVEHHRRLHAAVARSLSSRPA
jgi:2-succinyl-5-enolpyruvyl-6-hydroxy-3-cyclohexene-1-carboxylate synthase